MRFVRFLPFLFALSARATLPLFVSAGSTACSRMHISSPSTSPYPDPAAFFYSLFLASSLFPIFLVLSFNGGRVILLSVLPHHFLPMQFLLPGIGGRNYACAVSSRILLSFVRFAPQCTLFGLVFTEGYEHQAERKNPESNIWC